MKVLIIEDENLAAERLLSLVKEIEPDIEIVGPIDTIRKSIQHLQKFTDYDLIFMDIELADGKCFAIFNEVSIQTPIIFTTAYDAYALKAFELNSIDYLLKPIDNEKLIKAMDKFHNLKKQFSSEQNINQWTEMLKKIGLNGLSSYKERFLIAKSDYLISLKSNEIACFYVEEKEVFALTYQGKKHVIPYTMDDLNKILNPKDFFRINRQYIISINAIEKVYQYFNFKIKVELKTNLKIESLVSRSKTSEFKMWLNN